MEQIEAKHPFNAQSVRIRVFERLKRESICLRAEVYGCGVPRGKTRSLLDEDAGLIHITLIPSLVCDRFTNFDGSVVEQLGDIEV